MKLTNRVQQMTLGSQLLSKMSIGTYRLPRSLVGVETLAQAHMCGIRCVSTARAYYNDRLSRVYSHLCAARSEYRISYKLSHSDLDTPMIALANVRRGLERCGVSRFDDLVVEIIDDQIYSDKIKIVEFLSSANLSDRVGVSLPNPETTIFRLKPGDVSFLMVPASEFLSHRERFEVLQCPTQVFSPFSGGAEYHEMAESQKMRRIAERLNNFQDVEVVHFGASRPSHITDLCGALGVC